MPTLSDTKKQEIIDALVSCGVSPNEGAIAAVIEMQKNDGRISVATAAKRYAESVGSNHATQNRNQTRVSQGANIQSQVLDNAARGLATQMKKVIASTVIFFYIAILNRLCDFFKVDLF